MVRKRLHGWQGYNLQLLTCARVSYTIFPAESRFQNPVLCELLGFDIRKSSGWGCLFESQLVGK